MLYIIPSDFVCVSCSYVFCRGLLNVVLYIYLWVTTLVREIFLKGMENVLWSPEELMICPQTKNKKARIYTYTHLQTSNKKRTSVGNKCIDHSNVAGATPTLHLHSGLNTWLQWIGGRRLQSETRNNEVLWFGAFSTRGLTIYYNMYMKQPFCSHHIIYTCNKSHDNVAPIIWLPERPMFVLKYPHGVGFIRLLSVW